MLFYAQHAVDNMVADKQSEENAPAESMGRHEPNSNKSEYHEILQLAFLNMKGSRFLSEMNNCISFSNEKNNSVVRKLQKYLRKKTFFCGYFKNPRLKNVCF